MTRTNTRYCSDVSPGMEELKVAFEKIATDVLARAEHMDRETRRQIEGRLDLLILAWRFLSERVP